MSPKAPFIIVGAVNLIVMLGGLWLRAREAKDGGNIAKIAGLSVNVSSSVTARIQEVHITAGHVICDLVDIKLFQKPDLK